MKYKTDGNQSTIVAALKAAGYIVDDMSRHGRGFPDLLVWTKTVPAIAIPIEIKMPGQKLSKREQQWWSDHPDCLKSCVDSAEHALNYMAHADSSIRVRYD